MKKSSEKNKCLLQLTRIVRMSLDKVKGTLYNVENDKKCIKKRTYWITL